MMDRVHSRQLGGMTCVDILAAELGGIARLNIGLSQLPVRSVERRDDRDRQEMYWQLVVGCVVILSVRTESWDAGGR